MFDTSTVGLGAGESTNQVESEEQLIRRLTAEFLAAPDPEPSAPEWVHAGGRHDTFPGHLATLPTDMALAAIVFTTDRSQISAYDLVRLLQAEDRLLSAIQAQRSQTIGEITDVYGDPDAAAAEIGAALHLTRQASETEVELARQLAKQPPVWDLLRTGAIDIRRARVIVDGLRSVEDEVASQALDRILPEAAELTTGQLRSRLSRICMERDPQAAADRYQAGTEQRRVVLSANPDTTANLMGYDLPADLAAAAAKRINWLARKAKTRNDPRTLDQIRADVFLDLLTGRGHIIDGTLTGAPAGQVDIVVDLNTLTGESDLPGHIPGYGPVVAEIARKVAEHQLDCKWEYSGTDQGQPLATGTIRRRPTTAMKRHLRAQHPTCVWPGCRMPARNSDLDHLKRWEHGGATTIRNLAPLCDKHHSLLDKGWHYEPKADGGYKFTSPLGHTYISSGRSP